jgi:hypothetical protein
MKVENEAMELESDASLFQTLLFQDFPCQVRESTPTLLFCCALQGMILLFDNMSCKKVEKGLLSIHETESSTSQRMMTSIDMRATSQFLYLEDQWIDTLDSIGMTCKLRLEFQFLTVLYDDDFESHVETWNLNFSLVWFLPS